MSTGESTANDASHAASATDPNQYYYQYSGYEGYGYSGADYSATDYYNTSQYAYDAAYSNYYTPTPAVGSSGTVASLAAVAQNDEYSAATQGLIYSASNTGTKSQIVASTSGYAGPNAKTDSTKGDEKKKGKKKTIIRTAAGEAWEDPTLLDWDDNDFRLFAGDLGNEVTDEMLYKAFSKYPSLQRTRVVRDKRTGKSKGYGFISFRDPNEFVRAWREMNGKYVGNRPIKLRKSSWKDRNIDVRARKERERLGPYSKVR